MRRLLSIPTVVLLTLVFVAAGCYSKKPVTPGPVTFLEVENRSLDEHTMYVLRGSQRTRLGTVPGFSTRTFRLPASLVAGASSIRFLADPLGSRRTPVSQELYIRAGETLSLTILP